MMSTSRYAGSWTGDALWHDPSFRGSAAELPVEAGEALRQRLEALSVEGLLLVPLVIDGRVAASVKLTSTEPTEWSADADAELALGAFANSCVQALRRRRLEDELREAHGHLQHLVERSPVSMWRLSRDGVLTPVGTSTAEALGYGPEELAQQPEQLVHPDDLHVVAAEMSQVQAGHEAHFEVRMRHAEGNWVTFETFVRPELDQDGEYTGAVGYGIDVTDRKIAEEQLRRAQKLEAVGQLAGGVAHDFNNLLTVIYGYIELARAGDTSALGEALAAAERARRLVERLLTFSRQRDVNAVSVDLNAAIRSMHRMVNLVGTDIDVQLDLAADLPPVTADVGQLEQAILNLAVNARDAMRTGGTLTLRTDQPDPREIPDDVAGERFVRLQVADTGIGMTPDVAARAVDPFFTTKDEGHGTGLGLSSVYGVLTALGGTVRFETTPGQGTTFELFLPVASSPPESPQAEGEATTARRIDGATILLVEDQAQVGDLVANILGRAGHHILLAPDGPTALELAEGRHIDLVITDVAMPHMRGPQVAAALRSRVPDLPVIYMSGYTGEALPSDERSWFLQKPFTIAQLHGATTTALEHAPRITD